VYPLIHSSRAGGRLWYRIFLDRYGRKNSRNDLPLIPAIFYPRFVGDQALQRAFGLAVSSLQKSVRKERLQRIARGGQSGDIPILPERGTLVSVSHERQNHLEFFLVFINIQYQIWKKEISMDKTGVVSLVIGIVLLALGCWGVYVYLDQVILFLQGVIGIVGIVIGIFLVIFGVLMIKE
jgi:hypothetical protein